MTDWSQGDPLKIDGFKQPFLVLSKNAFIRNTGTFHVCPFLKNYPEGPLHIPAEGLHKTAGTAICEQLKLIDPSARNCRRIDRLPHAQMINISDAVQGIFEYD